MAVGCENVSLVYLKADSVGNIYCLWEDYVAMARVFTPLSPCVYADLLNIWGHNLAVGNMCSQVLHVKTCCSFEFKFLDFDIDV